MGLFTKRDESVMTEDSKKAGILENLGGGFVKTLLSLGLGWADLYTLAKDVSKGKSVKEALEGKLPSQTAAKVAEQYLPGLPITGPSQDKYAPVFAAGGGVVPLGGWGKGLFGVAKSALGGGAIAGGTQTLFPDSPVAQLAVGAGLPYTFGAAARVGKQALTKDMKAPRGEPVSGLTLGEVTGKDSFLKAEDKLRRDPKMSAKAQEYDKARTDLLKQRVEDVIGNRTLDDVSAARAAQNAVQKFVDTKTEAMRKQANVEFGAAKDAGGGFDMTPVVQKLDNLLAEFGDKENTSQTQTIINELKRTRDAYIVKSTPEVRTPTAVLGADGNPAGTSVTPATTEQIIHVDPTRMLNRLRDWSKYAATGEGVFADVDRTVTKHIASEVYSSYLQSLDDAANTSGGLIKTARDNYKKNMAEIDDIRSKPIIRFFNKENINELDSTQIIDRLKKERPEQRKYITSIVDQYDPEIMSNVRKSALMDMLDSGTVKGAPKGAPTFSSEQFLSKMDGSKKEFLDSLFTNPSERKEFNSVINQMRLAVRTPLSGNEASNMRQTLAQGAMAATGSGPAAAAVRAAEGVGDYLKNKLVGKDEMFNLLFNPEYRGKDLKSRVGEVSISGAKLVSPNITDLRNLATQMPTADEQAKQNAPSMSVSLDTNKTSVEEPEIDFSPIQKQLEEEPEIDFSPIMTGIPQGNTTEDWENINKQQAIQKPAREKDRTNIFKQEIESELAKPNPNMSVIQALQRELNNT